MLPANGWQINQFSVHSMSIQSARSVGHRIHWSGYCAFFVYVAHRNVREKPCFLCVYMLVGADFRMDALACHPSITKCRHHQTHVCVCPFVRRSAMFVCFTPAIFCMKNRQNVSALVARAKWMMMCRNTKNKHALCFCIELSARACVRARVRTPTQIWL